jgi:hypothetical protein
MGIIDFTLGPSGEQEPAADGRNERAAKNGRRWQRDLAIATAAAGIFIAARRYRRRRDDSEFTRIEIEGASPSVDG